jgi:uncharacterized protein with PIN domain
VKFLTDSTLGKLTKWLRILGYDTVHCLAHIDESSFTNAEAAGRVILTRNGKFDSMQYSGRLLVISHDRVADQIEEVINRLSLCPEEGQYFTRCLTCNEKLLTVSKEKISSQIPDYIRDNYDSFVSCPSCNGVFWPGTHRANMERFLRTRIPVRPL